MKLKIMGEEHSVAYTRLDKCLDDPDLPAVFEHDAVCSVWLNETRLTRDVTSWESLKQKLISNAVVIERHLRT